ncbi:hypothetical protein K2F43_21775 [Clostridium estertheticum]|uniref:hypothetical protein n=1 Tax=Clostridium estertheticum TaxID=238834 RepID=UPI001C6F539B|nr:hypothetical protein [Clostridium estertheticum]MBW9173799.1 hypothetical protein [Clostridium estertheticum]WLC76264.1 hypothetical protein KTC99_05465 [Clostridium estertheticum]
MIIYYPTYYLVPVAPVMFSYEDDYNARCNSFYNDEYSDIYSDDYTLPENNEYNDNHSSRYNIEDNEPYNGYRIISEDLFYEVDEEYVNDNIR